MSEKSEIVRRLTEHLNETGEPGPIDLYAEGLEFRDRGGAASPENYAGSEGVRTFNRSVREAWDSIRAEVIEETERGDWIVVAFRFHLRSHAGVELVEDEGWAYEIRDGKVQRIEQHGSFEEALAAVG